VSARFWAGKFAQLKVNPLISWWSRWGISRASPDYAYNVIIIIRKYGRFYEQKHGGVREIG
jgi:hypothetical protein